MATNSEHYQDPYEEAREWWKARRDTYNLWLIAAGFCSMLSYSLVGGFLIFPFAETFSFTLFEIIPQGIGYAVMMGIETFFTAWVTKWMCNTTPKILRGGGSAFSMPALFSPALCLLFLP